MHVVLAGLSELHTNEPPTAIQFEFSGRNFFPTFESTV